MISATNKIESLPNGALHQASQSGRHALSKLAQRPEPAFGNLSHADTKSDELESVFKQHPDLFREPSQQMLWDEVKTPIYSGAIHTLFIREQHTAPLLREYLLSDSRLYLCGIAECLGDACRQIRKQSYSVIVMAIGQHMQDMLPLLDLMNATNPRAKAVAVLEPQVIEHLQNMMHSKVLGYVAAQDADHHLADAIVEVSNGRFTASPGISQVVMRLASDYLVQKAAAINAQIVVARYVTANHAREALEPSDHSSSTLLSSHSHSTFLTSTINSDFGSASVAARRCSVSTSLLSEREQVVLMHIADGMSSAEIGAELAISVPTVNTHIRNIFIKLGAHTRAQAIHVGITQGMIEMH